MDRILCLEDSEDTILILTSALENYSIVFARTVSEALDFIRQEVFALFLIDIELSDGSGFEFVSELSPTMKDCPLLFLTGKQDFASKASAFSLGADDYITKPFDPRELKLRVDARLKRRIHTESEKDQWIVGDLICCPQEQRLCKKGEMKSIPLTSLEFRIFCMLSKEVHRIFTRDEILTRAWTDSVAVTDRTVDVHVSHLRRKISGSSVQIETVIGTGYRIKINSNSF